MGRSSRSTPARGEILLLGIESAGKTLLCKHLEHKSIKQKVEQPFAATTQPSIGVEMVEVANLRRNHRFTVREVGGVMQPVWHRYYDACSACVFVADSASADAAAGAVVELCGVLNQLPSEKRVVLFLNKRDAAGALPQETTRLVFGLDELEAVASGRLQVLMGSALTGDGLDELLDACVDMVVEREQLLAELAAKAAASAAAASAAASSAAAANAAVTSAEAQKTRSRKAKQPKGKPGPA